MPAYNTQDFDPPAPIAQVAIQHPEHDQVVESVPMLIDTGADATLLPLSAVLSLGLQATGETYRLIGFDGSSSEAESVDAGVVFLRRRFRGRYLLVDSPVGILGRDILNHLRLTLDGPDSVWNESST